ncbi:TIGR02679 domain-containing protein [Streptomyces flavidovirens]|uniref:TIGR02679 domain-containing protein n=1 Tax=Streptomyces flavidovirens TaxID=67298 RepID=A0ABW6R8N9_9ACTN
MRNRGDLADPDLRPLWQAISVRLAQGDDAGSIQTVRAELSRAGRAMLTGWLSRAQVSRRTVSLRIEAGATVIPVQRVLRALTMTPSELREVVEQNVGMIPPLAEERRRAAQLREDIWAYTATVLPDTPRLTARLQARGVVDDRAGELRRLIDALARARARLPLSRPATLARLSLNCAGDPHYFDLNDAGQGARLVLLAADMLGADLPDTPAAERALLARVGIVADSLSQTVLVLNVNATGDGPTDRSLRLAHEDQRPAHLTLHDLTTHPPTLDRAQPWLVVENPSVIHEALMRGVRSPIVCTSGTLTAVDHVLLSLARTRGISMEYSGDIDTGGRNIAAAAHRRYDVPSREMDNETLRAALAAGALSEGPLPVPTLAGPSYTPPTADCDPGNGRVGDPDPVIFQEHPTVLDRLLGPDPEDPLPLPGSPPIERTTPKAARVPDHGETLASPSPEHAGGFHPAHNSTPTPT